MAKKANGPLPLDDDQVADATETETQNDAVENSETATTTIDTPDQPPSVPAARQGDQHRPYCMRHVVLMSAYSSRDGVTRYRCPVPGCEATEKRAQPTSHIPREPHVCPHCAARSRDAGEKDPKPVYLESDWSHSTYAMLAMACPTAGCRFTLRMPRPDIAARSRKQRAHAERIGER